MAEAEQDRRPRLDSTAKVQLRPRICPICDQRYPADFKVCPRDAAKLEDAEGQDDDPLLGTVVGEAFRIVRPIGEGGTARVYEARHVRLESKRFAIKVLHGYFASQANVVARFAREAEAASAIRHPGIVEVHDVDRMADGRPYLVTELLEGEDFGSLLKARGKVPIPFAVRVARKVCQALSAAHAAGIVHRDLKPENIFLIGGQRQTGGQGARLRHLQGRGRRRGAADAHRVWSSARRPTCRRSRPPERRWTRAPTSTPSGRSSIAR